jgi:hypothetical protein
MVLPAEIAFSPTTAATRHLTKINRHNEHTYCTEDRWDNPNI